MSPEPDSAAHHRPGSAAHAKGRERLATILQCARDILVESGYPGLTMRRIADKAGISTGNLHYYYRRKSDLMQDLLNTVVAEYRARFAELRADAGPDPERQLRAILDFWITDLGSPDTTGFFPEVWALANHEDAVADIVDRMYIYAREDLVDLIPSINPRIDDTAVQRLALVMCASMEGLTIFAGHDKPWNDELATLREITIDQFMGMIRAAA